MGALPARDQLAPGTLSGEIANHRWRVDVLPFASQAVSPQSRRAMGATSCGRHHQITDWRCNEDRYVPLQRSQRQMRMPQRLDRTAMAGFTLIEALVATALMGLILAALATITAQWLPNWNRGVVRVQRNEQVALGLERLASDLAAAQFIPASQQTRKPFFDGTGQFSHVCAHRFRARMQDLSSKLFALPKSTVSKGPVLVRTQCTLHARH